MFFRVLLAIAAVSGPCQVLASKLSVVNVTNPKNELSLTSLDVENGIDHIWNISITPSIVGSGNEPYYLDLNVTTLKIRPEEGDFLVLCEYSLPYTSDFQNGSNIESALGKLPLQNSILVTSRLRYNVTKNCKIDEETGRNCEQEGLVVRLKFDITAGSPIHRGFIYLHTEPRVITGRADEEVIHVTLKEETPPPQATTTEKLPSKRRDDFYISRYIKGLTPYEFYNGNRTLVSSAIARIVEHYCVEKQITECEQVPNLNVIRFEQDDDIRFCDPTFVYYHTCVMLTFAVAIKDVEGNFTLNSTALNDMWRLERASKIDEYLKEIKSETTGRSASSYFPDSPYNPIETWIWVAAVLGIIIVFSTLMCYSLISDKVFMVNMAKNKQDFTKIDNDHGSRKGTWRKVNSNHPIIKVIHSMRGKFSKRGSIDTDTYTLSELDGASVSTGFDSNRSKNPGGGFTYKNPAFSEDEDKSIEPGTTSLVSRYRGPARLQNDSVPDTYSGMPRFHVPPPPDYDDDEEVVQYTRDGMMY